MNRLQPIVMLLACLSVVPSLWRLKVSGTDGALIGEDSYIVSIFKQASIKAFSLTYVFLMFVDDTSAFYLSSALI